MPDLRDVLRQGADVTTGLPDVPAVWAQAVRERRRRRAVAGLAVAAAMVVVALVGSVLGGGAGTRPLPAQPAEPPAAQALPAYPGPLQRDQTFDASAVGLPFGFSTADDGWTLAAREPGWVSLHRRGVRVNLQRWDGVVDPRTDRPDGTPPLALPADLAAWIDGHQRLSVHSRSTASIAGEDWVVLEVSVREPLDPPPAECGATPCVLLGVVGAEPVEVLDTERALVHVRDDDAQTVLVVTYPDRIPNPGPAVTHLLDSLHERHLR
jgi:hypothetical protein